MNTIETLTRILGLSFASGINLYATVLVVGLGIRYDWVSGLPPELAVLAHPAVLAVAGILYAVEFLADKIPVVASIWDVIHTVIRPVGGALLALAAIAQVHVNAPTEVIAFMAAGAVALGAHSTKMSFRLLATAAPHPVLHGAISLLEDLGVIALLALMYTHPLAALVVLLILIASIALAAPLLFRMTSLAIRAIAGRLVFWHPRAGTIPSWLTDALDLKGAGIYACFARSVPKIPRLKKGYLVRNETGVFFACKGRGKVRPLGANISAGLPIPGWMLDVITFCDARGNKSSVYLPKDQARRFRADSKKENPAPG